MKLSKKLTACRGGVALIASLLLPGCTTVWKQPVTLVDFPPHDKVNLRILLLISPELEQAHWQAMVDPVTRARIPLGPLLTANAESLARAVFSEVRVIRDPAARPSGSAALLPKLVSVERTQPTTIYGQQTTTLVLNWTLTNPKGETVWAETIKSDVTTKMGSNPKKTARLQFETAANELFNKSFQRLVASPEVKDLAVQK